MRYLKSLIIAAFVFAFAAGTVFAEDDALEIHGGGRIGVTVNSKGGSELNNPQGGNNALGSMPNYAETHYFGIALSKKTTADGGAWAKVSYYMDHWEADTDGDLKSFSFRTREFKVEFGGLDFMPAGSTLWAGLGGYGTGWNGMQDHSFINLAGIGFGIKNLGGIFSIAYMGEDHNDNNPGWAPGATYVDELGERTMHNFIASINMPMLEAYAAVGHSVAANSDEDALTQYYVGAVYHAPVMGINIGLAVSTDGYAKEIYSADSDTHLKGNHFSGVGVDDTEDAMGIRFLVWTVTDLAEGLYMAPSIRYDRITYGELDSANPTAGTENTVNRIDIALRLSKALTNNIAFVPVIGYEKVWDSEDTDGFPSQTIQGTLAVEIGLDTGYWAGQKIQFYGTYTSVDSDHEFGNGAQIGETSSMVFGTLVTFGF